MRSMYLHCDSKFYADTESRLILKKKERKEQSVRKLERSELTLYL